MCIGVCTCLHSIKERLQNTSHLRNRKRERDGLDMPGKKEELKSGSLDNHMYNLTPCIYGILCICSYL